MGFSPTNSFLQSRVHNGVDPADKERRHRGYLMYISPGLNQVLQPADIGLSYLLVDI